MAADVAQLMASASRYIRLGSAVPAAPRATWDLEGFAGRLAEITGGAASAVLSAAMSLVRDAQEKDETAAWITPLESLFYPPDAAAMGIDLGALAVVRAPFAAMAKAADRLTRSGGFGLVVMDMSVARYAKEWGGQRGDGWLSRLLGLAKRHDTAIVFLTDATNPPLGTLISLRGEVRRRRHLGGAFEVDVHIVKDKRSSPGGRHLESFYGPAGLS
jgi:recombination protein RecA